MPRAATTSDVFNAIAEPRRRRIIELLASSGCESGTKSEAAAERTVGELVRALRLPQPSVSKHLRVLRRVRLVSVRRRGRERVYRLNPSGLKTVHDWVKFFERFWSRQLIRIKDRAERKTRSK